MKQFTIGLIIGIALSVSCAAFAVNYSRDIAPLNYKVDKIELRVAELEKRCFFAKN